jgi:hypothetical protein
LAPINLHLRYLEQLGTHPTDYAVTKWRNRRIDITYVRACGCTRAGGENLASAAVADEEPKQIPR